MHQYTHCKQANKTTQLLIPPTYLRPQAGDEVVRVNGLTLTHATHEEVVNLVKLKKTLTLSLRGQSSTCHTVCLALPHT